MSTNIHFEHGLGDCVYFAHQLPLYQKRGIEIGLSCPVDKEIIFKASGVQLIRGNPDFERVPWHESHHAQPETADQFWTYNKSAINLNQAPLPQIGEPKALWEELCSQRLDIYPHISAEKKAKVRSYLNTLPKPVILIHSMGNTGQEWKNVPAEITKSLYFHLLDAMDGTLLLLDWDNRVPRLANWRVRHLTDDWEWLDTESLLCLLDEADLMLGVDSGPTHAARFTKTPTVVLFPHADHYPTRWCLPREEQVNVVTQGTGRLNQKTRAAFNIIECAESRLDPSLIAKVCVRMLDDPRYLDRGSLGKDVLLQEFAREWERGRGNGLSEYVDRDRSYDMVLREASRRFEHPVMVETGCIRAEEDWRGAGFSTYLLGIYAEARQGHLSSVDISPENCDFARRTMKPFSRTEIVCQDSLRFLREFEKKIDVLLLDSVDTDEPFAPQHALAEAQAAAHALHQKSLIIFDDSPYFQRQFRGKGALAIPWLLENGWRIAFSGYQTVLKRA